MTIQNVACSLAISVSVLQKGNLILWNCFLKIQDRSLIKNGFMSVFGAMTARGTAALWQSISAGYGLKLLHMVSKVCYKQSKTVLKNQTK